MTRDSALLRLRAANPVPHPVAGSSNGEHLFERITALEQRTPLRRRTYRRPLLVFVVAIAAVAVLASAAFAISQWLGGDVVKPNVTLAEYRAAQKELQLPPGAAWPGLRVDPNSVTTRGGGGGYAVVQAEVAWDCYWVDAIRRHDLAGQIRARARVESLLRDNVLVAPVGASENWSPANPPQHPYAVFAHDGGYEWLRETYALAAAGHPARLAQRCAANQ
jgi:hypothetical protein